MSSNQGNPAHPPEIGLVLSSPDIGVRLPSSAANSSFAVSRTLREIGFVPPLSRMRPPMPQISFEIVAECSTTRARAGLLHTPHGVIETPVFMPVGTQATVKGLNQRDLAADLGVKILLANTYHLYLRPGHQSIRQMGGLHRFMSWPNAILTDSGGFQVFSLSGLRKITDSGVVFQSHLNGDRHMFTPESTIDVQLALGSDTLMALDECIEYPVSHEYARESMHRTVRS